MRRTLIAALAAVAALILPAPASAYVRSRSADGRFDIIWPDPQITLTVRTGGTAAIPPEDFVAAVTRAAATWSDPALASSVVFTVVSVDEASTDPTYDHVNSISFRSSSWDPPYYAHGELALTTVSTLDGRIVDTDTELNAFDPMTWAILPDDPAVAAGSSDIDVQNTVTHELGHVLGLDHPCYLGNTPPDPPEVTNEGAPVPSCADPALPASVRDATMFPSARTGSIGARTLSPDEVLALHDLYPAGQAPVVDGPPEASAGGCAVAGEAGAPSGAALSAVALLMARARRRHARRRDDFGR
jgi:hypothetical protein